MATKKSEAAETKKAATKTTTKAPAKKAPAKKVYAYVFFNCDDGKNQASMNIRYNNEIFADRATSRKALLEKVLQEVKDGRVNLADKERVTEIILKGEPAEASVYMQYGTIERVIMH